MQALKHWIKRIYTFNTYNRDLWVKSWAGKAPAGARVLDMGAGPGRYRELFSHCDYRAQDFGQELGTIGRYTKLDYECDLTAVPAPDASFDVILCTEVLEHVPDPAAAIAEMARLLRPGGRVLLTAPLGSFLHQLPYHYYGGYTPEWYRRFLTEKGFAVEQIESNEGFFSWLSQETLRLSYLLSPFNPKRRAISFVAKIVLTLLWLLSLPLAVLFAPLAHWLDRLQLDDTATIGYHVAAVRRG
jgi:SAM-dependent methyltransferase